MRPAEQTPRTRRHAITVLVIWLVLTAIAELLAYQVHMPPGDMTVQADDQSRTLTLLLMLAIPVFFGVVVFMTYCFIAFRQPRNAEELLSGPAAYGNLRIQVAWVVISGILVAFMAAYGALTLVNTEAAKAVGAPGRAVSQGNITGSEAESKISPNGQPLVVQVIGQQWFFTYRYPSFGGVETTHLEIPEGTRVEFHVTSLDVIHSFWAYELGVKADAVPGNDNVAYATTEQHTGAIHVRCAELCGLWHGEMADTSGQVVSGPDFINWINGEQAYFAEIKQYLPKYSDVYYPKPLTRGT